MLRNSLGEFLCGRREDEKKRGFSWTHDSLQVGPEFHTKQIAVAGSLCREPAMCHFKPNTSHFLHGDECHPPAIFTGPHNCPAPSTTCLLVVNPLGEVGQSTLQQGGFLSPFLGSEPLVPWWRILSSEQICTACLYPCNPSLK